MSKVVVSVPGKIHLMGEHAVVYGKPAFLAAINLRLYVTVEVQSSKFKVQSYNSKIKKNLEIESSEPPDYIRHIIGVVQAHFKIKKLPALKISISSQIPAGYHLGSSAAVAVATVGAVTYFLKKLWNPALFNQLAYEAEKKMHGNPSGGDNTAVTFGGFIWYRKELEFLKSIWQLPLKLPANLAHFFLIDTGRPKETTGEMVEFVKFKVQSSKFKVKMQKLFSENEEQTKRVAKALKEGDERELIEVIKGGERTLEGMGVVSPKVIPLIHQIEKAGGAAKILGGGGRKGSVGFLLGYHRELKKIQTVCQSYGYSLQSIILGEEGIRLERKT
ncbi:MAG: mevalonate kinase [Patescibacteria group bacterium]